MKTSKKYICIAIALFLMLMAGQATAQSYTVNNGRRIYYHDLLRWRSIWIERQNWCHISLAKGSTIWIQVKVSQSNIAKYRLNNHQRLESYLVNKYGWAAYTTGANGRKYYIPLKFDPNGPFNRWDLIDRSDKLKRKLQPIVHDKISKVNHLIRQIP